MLRDFLDREMQGLDWLDERIDEAGGSFEAAQHVILATAAEREDRVALILDPKSHPDRWLFELAEFLASIEDDEIRAMAKKSEAAGNPPAGYEFVVSCQITAALLRGHLIPSPA